MVTRLGLDDTKREILCLCILMVTHLGLLAAPAALVALAARTHRLRILVSRD